MFPLILAAAEQGCCNVDKIPSLDLLTCDQSLNTLHVADLSFQISPKRS